MPSSTASGTNLEVIALPHGPIRKLLEQKPQATRLAISSTLSSPRTMASLKRQFAADSSSLGNYQMLRTWPISERPSSVGRTPLSLQETLAVQPGRPLAGAVDFVGQRFLKNATGSDALVNSALDRFRNPIGTPAHAFARTVQAGLESSCTPDEPRRKIRA